MSASDINLVIEKNSDFEVILTIEDSDTGLPLNLSNKTVASKFKKNYQSSSSVSFVTEVVNGPKGKVRLSLPLSVCSGLTAQRYVYDLVTVDNTNGKKERIVEGIVVVHERATSKIGTIPQNSANRICIAVIDENSNTPVDDMENLWVQFREKYPKRKFYLLQPAASGNTSIDALACPPSFLEETDPLSTTELSQVKTQYTYKYGYIVTETDGTGCYNNIGTVTVSGVTQDVTDITDYGVIYLGLSCNCGDLSNLISFLSNNLNRLKILSYLNSGGVVWLNAEWFNGLAGGVGCCNKNNVNTVLTLLGATIRQDADAPIVGNLTRSANVKVIESNFPPVMYCNATATWTGGNVVYEFSGVDYFGNTQQNTRCTVYEKIGNGVLYVSGDTNTYDNGVYALKPPNEMYAALRNLVLTS